MVDVSAGGAHSLAIAGHAACWSVVACCRLYCQLGCCGMFVVLQETLPFWWHFFAFIGYCKCVQDVARFHSRLHSPPNAEDGTAYGFGGNVCGQCAIPVELLGVPPSGGVVWWILTVGCAICLILPKPNICVWDGMWMLHHIDAQLVPSVLLPPRVATQCDTKGGMHIYSLCVILIHHSICHLLAEAVL